jgi:hypothetical protein
MTSQIQNGVTVDWGIDHADKDGNLICRDVMIHPPTLTCNTFGCMARYWWSVQKYLLTMRYHAARVAYCEKHRTKAMPEHYRTGEKAPTSILGLLWGITNFHIWMH